MVLISLLDLFLPLVTPLNYLFFPDGPSLICSLYPFISQFTLFSWLPCFIDLSSFISLPSIYPFLIVSAS